MVYTLKQYFVNKFYIGFLVRESANLALLPLKSPLYVGSVRLNLLIMKKQVDKTGIFQPPFPTVENQSSSIIVQNTLNTPEKVDNRLIAANSTNTPIQPNAGETLYLNYWKQCPNLRNNFE